MKVIEHMETYEHEQLAVYVDRNAGLRSFVAIHDTTLGPALGGCRVWPHPSEEAAITDVLRLARGMTYKNAAAGLDLGGGKGLIWADPRKDKSEAMFRAFGRFVESLGGRYITTEDVGTAPGDMLPVRQETRHVVGLPVAMGGSGDPSLATGFGIYQGIRACIKEVYHTDSVKDMAVAIQGFGKVASFLVQHLQREGARITVTDINRDALGHAAELGMAVVEDPETIYDVPCQVFSPCALGGVLNGKTIPRLKAKVVAGCANNQLLAVEDAEELHRRGILYAPDFIINAGGVINISFEIGRPYSQEAAMDRVARIYDTVTRVIAISKREGIPTAKAADRLAEERIAQVRRARNIYLGPRATAGNR